MMEEIVRRPIIFIEGGQVFKLACLGGVTSVEHLPEICSSHEDTDVRISISVKHIQTTMSHIKTIRVRSKDSDIFFILLYFAKSFTVDILMDTGEKLIIISQLADNYSQEHIAALLALLAFIGADCTSAFKGRGKVRPMKLLSQNSKFIHIFAAVSLTWTLGDDQIINGIEEFTCRLYGVGPRVKQVDVAREFKVKNICGSNVDLRPGLSIDLSTFPPCKRVLAQHTKRVNFHVCIWRRALDHFPEIPSPLDHGYIVTEAGQLEPFWFEGDIIPMVLVDILEENGNDEEITYEIHTVGDYDEDENDEYDDN